jgi:hypothetical protein
MIPWLVIAAIVVPLVVVAFVATRRRDTAGEAPATSDPKTQARTEEEFAAAEAYEAEWREEDHEHYREERLP